MRGRRAAGFASAWASLAVALAASADEPAPEPSHVGQAICRNCHPVEASHWAPTVHGRISEHARTELEGRGCESCHGPGSSHVAQPDDPSRILAFTRDARSSVEEMNGMCLQCHLGGERIQWFGSRHETQGLACSDCHNPMAETSTRHLLAKAGINRTCYTCHPQQRAEFRKRSHMPLPEGKIACSDCHNPHGSYTDPLLRGDSVNDLCTRCHADKRGPFLWEHPPVAENCLSCHRPHGSSREALLVTTPPFLCQGCHSSPRGFSHPNDLLVRENLPGRANPDVRLVNRGCVNCHVQIHGSNHPSGSRFHR